MNVNVWFRSLPEGQEYLFIADVHSSIGVEIAEALELEFNVEAWTE